MTRIAKRLVADDFSPYRIAEFWSKVRLTVTGCMEFTGGERNSQGYGCIEMRGRTSRQHRRCAAHRAAYAMTWGECPAGLDLLHSCDNPKCVNPQHLRLGTHLENMQDMAQKGRHGLKARRGPDNPLFGRTRSAETRAKISATKRLRFAQKGKPQ